MTKRIFSGVQPSGNLHIGNYLGAIKNWVKLQDEYDCVFCVVDLHAITVPQEPEKLKKQTIEVAKILMASGIDPNKSTIFIQSHIPEHTELTWILNTIAKVGDLTKMTQLKEKASFMDLERFVKAVKEFGENVSDKRDKKTLEVIEKLPSILAEKISRKTTADTIMKFLKETYLNPFNEAGVGLFNYPVLMAADILLYDTNLVPVGEDQIQHIEITRTLAKRFNQRFGETFVIPEPYVTKEGMRVMGLDDPTKKMAKSAASEYNYVALLDNPDIIRKKIQKAVTDSGREIIYQDDKPALQNLIDIYSAFSGKTPKEIEKMYEGKGPASTRGERDSTRGGYADFKKDLAEVIIEKLGPIQEKYHSLSDKKVLEILTSGADKVRPMAKKKLEEVKNKIGLVL